MASEIGSHRSQVPRSWSILISVMSRDPQSLWITHIHAISYKKPESLSFWHVSARLSVLDKVDHSHEDSLHENVHCLQWAIASTLYVGKTINTPGSTPTLDSWTNTPVTLSRELFGLILCIFWKTAMQILLNACRTGARLSLVCFNRSSYMSRFKYQRKIDPQNWCKKTASRCGTQMKIQTSQKLDKFLAVAVWKDWVLMKSNKETVEKPVVFSNIVRVGYQTWAMVRSGNQVNQ